MTDYQRALKTWSPEWVEELLERVAIIMEGTGCSAEQAEQQAVEIVSKRMRER